MTMMIEHDKDGDEGGDEKEKEETEGAESCQGR